MKVLISAATALLLLSANGPIAAQRQHSIVNDAETMAREEAYWTEERLRNAIPHPLPEVNDEQLEMLLQEGDISGLEVQTQEGSGQSLTPGVPVRANVGQRPFWNGGVLFFTKPNGKDYQCTAEFTGQNNILLTAAHCVRDGSTGAWYKNFSFRRAYNNGGGQTVGWQCAMAYYMWASPPNNYKYDYAFIHTSSTSGAGWLGWKTMIPYTTWTAIGYPQNYGNNQYMYQVVGDKGGISGGIVQMNNNPMTFGASGGAWIGELTIPHVGGNYAVGLNSFINSSNPGKMWGPLFDGQWASLYYKTVNNCTE